MPHAFCRGFVAALVAVAAVSLLSCSNGSNGGVDDDDDDDGDEQPAPAAIADLRAIDTSTVSVTLAWTVPDSDATHGAAHWYDLRYYADPITVSNWSSATRWLAVPPAQPGGCTESVTVSVLVPGSQYYFALDCSNAYAQWSGLSNVIGVKTRMDAVVEFPDTALEAVIREAIGKSTGAIMSSDLQSLQQLNAGTRGIHNLAGLEHCTALRMLHLSENPIENLAPLAGLHELRVLGLRSAQVRFVDLLSGLTNLEQLILPGNHIRDIAPLSGLVNLRVLTIGQNDSIADLSALSGMTRLTWLNFQNNSVSDLAPLADLDSLQTIYMRVNQVSDLTPLIANAGLGAGDEIWMEYNPLSQHSLDVDIPALQARGVLVHF